MIADKLSHISQHHRGKTPGAAVNSISRSSGHIDMSIASRMFSTAGLQCALGVVVQGFLRLGERARVPQCW